MTILPEAGRVVVGWHLGSFCAHVSATESGRGVDGWSLGVGVVRRHGRDGLSLDTSRGERPDVSVHRCISMDGGCGDGGVVRQMSLWADHRGEATGSW